jgi:hypothetical protein
MLEIIDLHHKSEEYLLACMYCADIVPLARVLKR